MKLGLNIAVAALLLVLVGCGEDKGSGTNNGNGPFVNTGGIGTISSCAGTVGTPIDAMVPYYSSTLAQNSVVLSLGTTAATYPGQFQHAIIGQGNFYFPELVPMVYQANVLPQVTTFNVCSTTPGTLMDVNQFQKRVTLALQAVIPGTRSSSPVYPQIYPPTTTPTPTTEAVNVIVNLTFTNAYIDRNRPTRISGSAMVQISVQGANGQIQNLPARGYGAQ